MTEKPKWWLCPDCDHESYGYENRRHWNWCHYEAKLQIGGLEKELANLKAENERLRIERDPARKEG